MKKQIIYLLALVSAGLSTYAQTTSDAFHYAKTQNFGTARFQSLGGAFGALGGDLTALGDNPAGSAVFSTSSGSLTIGLNNKSFSNSYFDNTSKTDRNNLLFDQIGGVIVMEPGYETKVKKLALSINYQKEADYRNDISFNASNVTNSIGNYFAENANGVIVDDLGARENEFIDQAYEAIGRTPGLGRQVQQSFLAFESGIIYPDFQGETDPSVIGGISNYLINAQSNNEQSYNTRSSGSNGKVVLNGALQYESGFHIGLNLNIHSVDRITDSELNERAFTNTGAFIYDFSYFKRTNDFSAGFSAGIGFIQKIENLRIGGSYQTPTWHAFTSEVEEYTRVSLSNNAASAASLNQTQFGVDPELIYVIEDYGLRTPGKLSGSLAYTFGKYGLISAQYDRVDFSKTRYDKRYENHDFYNDNIKNTFTVSETFRLGAEARAKQWRFRAGTFYTSSPYKDNSIDGESQGYSLGIGYDWGKWKLDASYVNSETNYNETPLENNSFNNSGNIDINRDQISVTLGVNF